MFVVAALSLLALLSVQTIRCVAVYVLSESNEFGPLETALHFDPDNDRVLHRLGLVSLWKSGNTTHALPLLRRATEVNPHNAQYQQDLGTACEVSSQTRCANQAFFSATSLAPRSPRFQLGRANYLLATAQPTAALASLHNYLELQPDDARTALEPFVRAIANTDEIWKALPRTGDHASQLALISLLADNSRFDISNRYWRDLVHSGATVPLTSSAPYLNALQSHAQLPQTVDVWRDLQRMHAVPAQEEANLAFNGGFEFGPSNVGLDWHYQQQRFVQLNFSDSSADTGTRSLRIDFTSSSNEQLNLLEQLVPVAGRGTYQVSAAVRSQSISSACGPRLRIQDFLCSSCIDVSTEGTVGTSGFHKVSTTFSVGPQTRFLRLSIYRPRCRTYPVEITGQFWIDSINLQQTSR